jgi:hypothetical protein
MLFRQREKAHAKNSPAELLFSAPILCLVLRNHRHLQLARVGLPGRPDHRLPHRFPLPRDRFQLFFELYKSAPRVDRDALRRSRRSVLVFYAITGAISSAPFIVLYNATSRFWPAVTATFEPGKPPAESAQQPPPAQSGAAPTR